MNKEEFNQQRTVDALKGLTHYIRIEGIAPIGTTIELTKVSNDTWFLTGEHSSVVKIYTVDE